MTRETTTNEPGGASAWTRRSVPWIGALIVVVIVATATLDLRRTYYMAIEETDRDLNAHARIIAEQTARSVQAVDVVLRHVAAEYRRGRLGRLKPDELHAYLNEQAVGLVQIDGLALHDASGDAMAISWLPSQANVNVSQMPGFSMLRNDPQAGLSISPAARSPSDQQWIVPIGRRLENANGEFAGVVGARGRIEYFEAFYRDVRLDQGATIVLMHSDGTLIARQPRLESAIGQHFTLLFELHQAYTNGQRGPIRTVSPIDGVDRFAALQSVPDYPLEIIVTRDAAVALARWREAAWGTAVRTLGLALLATLLMAMLMRQFARLEAARQALDSARERFALAAAGSDDGLLDWDISGGRVYASARAREILGLAPGPEWQSREQWFSSLQFHPDDAQRRMEDMQGHLKGHTPVYAGEYRIRHPDGRYRWVRFRGLCTRDANGDAVRMAGSVADIDVRKHAEESLRESEQRYALAMTGSNEGHWVWDIASDGVYVSPRLNELFGLPPDLEVKSRSDYLEKLPLHPDDRPALTEALEAHLAGDLPRLDVEYRIVRDGEIRWLHVRGQCFRDEQGRPLRMAGSTVDISERKHAEEALRLSEERYAIAMTGSNEAHWVWDMATDEVYASPKLKEVLGISGDALPTSRREFFTVIPVHSEDVERFKQAVADHLEARTSRIDVEYRVTTDRGEVRWLHTRGQCFRDADGKPQRVAGATVEITERKRAEEAVRASEERLRQSEQRYQLAVAGVNQGVWDWDLASDTVFMSARAQALFGLQTGEQRRPRHDWIAQWTYHPDDRERVRHALSEYLRGAARSFEVEYRLRHADGQWRWYHDRGVALRDERGRPYRMAGSIEDITDRKQAEAERDRLEQQLRQAQKLEAMGTLAGGIAHDFNNILAAILGYGEMAQKEALEGSALRRHLDAAMSAGMRAKSLVERILAFSRSGMGERVPVHVQSVVAEVLDTIAGSLPDGVRLERRLTAGDAAVLGDPTQLHQVVMNLCTNAVQAIGEKGSVMVSIDTVAAAEARPVTTSELAPGSYVRLQVADTGTGIAPQIIERIFDPFFTTKEVGVGTGLGLSLVHGIVTDLGGGIDVASGEGAGSTFTVYLPWNGCTTAPARVEQAVTFGAGETVLLVDDEPALVRLGEEMLAELGYEPVGFTSSRAALQEFSVAPGRFDIVLTDEAMPGMTGSELAAEIRRMRPEIPILLMSGYVTQAWAARARDAGVREVLAKPLVSGDIARSLASALQR